MSAVPTQLDIFPAPLDPSGFSHDSVDLNSYDKIILAFSGGKDSIAMFLHLLERGVDKSKLELWHHEIDGREGSHFMDWPVTKPYCEAFAQAFEVPIYFSWKKYGFKGEMLRHNSKTAPTCFEDQNKVIHTVGGSDGKESTRLKFPQISTNLQTRWCSAYLKIDVMCAGIINQPRFKNSKTLVLSGERGEESEARSKYSIFEPDRADNRKQEAYELVTKMKSSKGKVFEIRRLIEPGKDDRHVDRYRAIRDWTEKMVWDIIARWRVRVPPMYFLGWSRVSCLFCIFGNADQFRSAYEVSRLQGEEIIRLEKAFNCTIKRNESVEQLIERGTPYPGLKNKALLEIARSSSYPLSIIMEEGEWVLPAGAFSKGCGPS